MTLLYFLTLFPLVPALGMLFATASVQNLSLIHISEPTRP